ncbi:MAG: hypothetical protein IJH04_07680 [Eggerthellaceae bacterium]|nr:hypothetical protein [Eggerthellaceae bacterium]
MNERKNWDALVEALCRHIDEWPLGKWVMMEELASLAPDIEFDEDEEQYTIAGTYGPFSPEDIDDAEVEVQAYAEEKGLFVDQDFDKGICLHERIDPAVEFDFDEIEYLKLTYEPALLLGGQSKAVYDGETLEVAPEWKDASDFQGKSVKLDQEGTESLRSLIEEAGVPTWNREYAPIGYMVLDGWGWSLLIRLKNGKVFASEGSNAWPETLGLFWEGLFDIVGLEVSDGDERPEWVCELVGQDDEE